MQGLREAHPDFWRNSVAMVNSVTSGSDGPFNARRGHHRSEVGTLPQWVEVIDSKAPIR
jgi:hypothetical protein